MNAFDELAENQIITLHRAGYTDEDAQEEIAEAMEALSQAGIRPKGYVYYHTGQLEKALDEEKPRLDLSFGAVTKAKGQIIEVGNLITATLNRYGLSAKWSGVPGDDIRIKDIDWRKEPDDEDWSLDRTVEIMIEAYQNSLIRDADDSGDEDDY